MLLVIDANVIFAALIARGGTFRVFATNKILRKFRFITPEYLFIEIREHFDEIMDKTKLSQEELEVVFDFVEEQIEIIPFEEFEDMYDKANKVSPDIDDVPYFALALKMNCGIWSNDKELKKQDIVKIYSTEDVIQMLEM